MTFNFSSSTKIRVRYGETDQMGYCYYGNYAQYFEVGRVEALREVGLSYKEMEAKGIMLPVSEYTVKYISPAFYDDKLIITTKISSLKGCRLFFEYEIYNAENKKIAFASTTLVFVLKSTMKPVTPPEDFLKLMNNYEIK
jgi:acyl-CoA thioester hydrolase